MPQVLPTTHLSTPCAQSAIHEANKSTNHCGELIARKTQSLSSTINIPQITSDDDLQVLAAATGLFPKIKDCNRIDFNAPANTGLEQCLRFHLTSTCLYLPFACSEKVPKSLGGAAIRYDYDSATESVLYVKPCAVATTRLCGCCKHDSPTSGKPQTVIMNSSTWRKCPAQQRC